jgi:hypothetical protein
MEAIPLLDLATETRLLLSATDWEAPKCIVYSNFCRINANLAKHHETRLWTRSVHKFPPVFLGKLPARTDLVIPNDEDFLPITQGDEALAEQVPPYLTMANVQEVCRHVGPSVTYLAETGVLIGRFGIRTWGHWIGELLPKMVILEEVLPLKCRYILPQAIATNPGYQPLLESLECYGITRNRLLLLSPGRYRLPELFAITSVWTQTKMHPQASELMRRKHQAQPRRSYPTKIALLRTESKTRNIYNLDQVLSILNSSGFQVVEIGRLSFAEQVRVFEAADIVAAVLGSGLAGVIYARLGIKVLTLAPGSWADGFFFAMMQLRDAKLADIRGWQAEGDNRSPATAKFVVNAAEISNGLAALG